MIRGDEPNIIKCRADLVQPHQGQLALADKRKPKLSKSERMEQRLFNRFLRLQRAAGKLWWISPDPARASTIEPGHPDYTIWLKGRVLLIEMKNHDGKLSPEQEGAISRLEDLDQPVHIVWDHVEAQRLVERYIHDN